MDIKNLIGETTEYDKKEMLEEKKSKSWCKSVSAFANGRGGMLIFGIADDDKIVGLNDAVKDSETISEQIKVNLDPIPEFNLVFEKMDGKNLIVLEVYAGDETPYYFIGNKERTAFVRRGNQSVPADRLALKKLVMKGAKITYDSMPANVNFEDLSFSQLRAAFYQATGISMTDEDFTSFGIIDQNGVLTNAGALLADDSPVRHSRLFCTRWNGLTMASGLVDAIDDDEYSDGLVQLLKNGINFIKRNSKNKWKKLPQGRMDMPDYPARAVFEGLCNALIHRDYMILGSEVHIDMYDDRLEIFSPGGMIDGSLVQDVDVLHIASMRRNPIIADIFSRLRYVDRRGSGFRKIIEDYKRQPTYIDDKRPVFYSERESFFLELKNLNYENPIVDKLLEKNSSQHDDTVSIKLDDIDRTLIDALEKNSKVSQRQLAISLRMNRGTVNNHIKKLVNIGAIKNNGSTQKPNYIILKKDFN